MNYLNTKSTVLFSLIIIGATISFVQAQSSSSSCARLYHHTRRSGMFVAGQLQIPVDAAFPQFKLEFKLSKAVHSVTVSLISVTTDYICFK